MIGFCSFAVFAPEFERDLSGKKDAAEMQHLSLFFREGCLFVVTLFNCFVSFFPKKLVLVLRWCMVYWFNGNHFCKKSFNGDNSFDCMSQYSIFSKCHCPELMPFRKERLCIENMVSIYAYNLPLRGGI